MGEQPLTRPRVSGGSAWESYPFLKGHGTQNDFVLLPDHDGSIHGELSVERVRALCDRRAGIGGDGVLRVIRTAAIDAGAGQEAAWFMDYRNADGSFSEMCGNGVRVFALHLIAEGLADPTAPFGIATRDGVKTVWLDGDEIAVDMGSIEVLGQTEVEAHGRAWAATHVDLGNPHAVAFLDDGDDLAVVGPLVEAPTHDPGLYPEGVNVEFVVRRGQHHVAMRVHERGSGETRSCGTGACAVMAATATLDGAERDTPYRIDLPGGTLTITWTADGRVHMVGPAVIVAQGTTTL